MTRSPNLLPVFTHVLHFVTCLFAITTTLWLPLPLPEDDEFRTLFFSLILRYFIAITAFEISKSAALWITRDKTYDAPESDRIRLLSRAEKRYNDFLAWIFLLIGMSIFLLSAHKLREEVFPSLFYLLLAAVSLSAISAVFMRKDFFFSSIITHFAFLSISGALPLIELMGEMSVHAFAISGSLASLALTPYLLKKKILLQNTLSSVKLYNGLLLLPVLFFGVITSTGLLPVQYYLLCIPAFLLPRAFILPELNIPLNQQVTQITFALSFLAVELILLVFLRLGTLI